MHTDVCNSRLSRGSDENPAEAAAAFCPALPAPGVRPSRVISAAERSQEADTAPPPAARAPKANTHRSARASWLRSRKAPAQPRGSKAQRGPLRGSQGFPGRGGGGEGGRPPLPSFPESGSCLSPPGNRCGRGSALCAGAGEARAVRAPTAVTLFALAVNSLRVPPPPLRHIVKPRLTIRSSTSNQQQQHCVRPRLSTTDSRSWFAPNEEPPRRPQPPAPSTERESGGASPPPPSPARPWQRPRGRPRTRAHPTLRPSPRKGDDGKRKSSADPKRAASRWHRAPAPSAAVVVRLGPGSNGLCLPPRAQSSLYQPQKLVR